MATPVISTNANQYPNGTQPNPQHAPSKVNANQYASPAKPDYGDSVRSKLYREEKKETEKKEREREKRVKEYREEEAKERKKRTARMLGSRRPGVEMPKQGLHRLGHAASGLTDNNFGISFSPGGAGYQDAFSIGSEFGRGGGRSASYQMQVDFGGMSPGFGGAKEAMRKDNNARGFGGYQDPFGGSGMSMGIGKAKRGRKPKRAIGSLFNLRLF